MIDTMMKKYLSIPGSGETSKAVYAISKVLLPLKILTRKYLEAIYKNKI